MNDEQLANVLVSLPLTPRRGSRGRGARAPPNSPEATNFYPLFTVSKHFYQIFGSLRSHLTLIFLYISDAALQNLSNFSARYARN